MIKQSGFAVILALTPLIWGVPTDGALDEVDYIARLKVLKAASEKADVVAVQNLRNKFGTDVVGQNISVSYAQVQEVIKGQVLPEYCSTKKSMECPEGYDRAFRWKGTYGALDLPYIFPRWGNWAVATKDYEGVLVHYYVLLESPCLADQFVEGSKLSFNGVIIGLGAEFTHVIVADIFLATRRHVQRCSNGHEYFSTDGFKFCPKCGQPLKAYAE